MSRNQLVKHPYVNVGNYEGVGRFAIGIQIDVAVPYKISEAMESKIYRAINQLKDELYYDMEASDPETMAAIERENKKILACFPEPYNFKKLPNGYGEGPNRPWFYVFTPKGPITIGWRRSVISIEWKDTVIEGTAEQLFPDQDVTKIDKLIHAHGYEAAERYLKVLLA